MQMITRPGTLLRWHALKRLLRTMVRDGMTVLDIGSYDGYIAGRLREWAPRATVVVVDLDMRGLSTALRRETGAVCASASALPVAAGVIDVLLCLDMIEHVTEDEAIFGEIERVLKKGGKVILTTPGEEGISFPFMSSEGMARMAKEWGHVRLGYSMEQLRRLFLRHGLSICREGKCNSVLSRLAYKMLILDKAASPAAWWVFRKIAPLEGAISWGAQGRIIVGEKRDG
jgi:SAM-dependent methyltransferase